MLKTASVFCCVEIDKNSHSLEEIFEILTNECETKLENEQKVEDKIRYLKTQLETIEKMRNNEGQDFVSNFRC